MIFDFRHYFVASLLHYFVFTPHGTSCISSPIRRGKDHSAPPSRPRAPASEHLLAPARSDIANPSAGAPASVRVRAQNPAVFAVPLRRVPLRSPPQPQLPRPAPEAVLVSA